MATKLKILKITRTDSFVQIRHEVTGYTVKTNAPGSPGGVKEATGTEERDITAHEAPMKSFDKALQALTDVVVNVLETGEEWKKGIVIKTVAFSYTKKGTRSAAIFFTRDLDATGTAHRMSTPFVQVDDAAEGEEGRMQVAKEHSKAIKKLITEAEKYADGERDQRMLPLDDGKSENAEPAQGDTLDFPAQGGDTDTPPAEEPKKKRGGKKAAAATSE